MRFVMCKSALFVTSPMVNPNENETLSMAAVVFFKINDNFVNKMFAACCFPALVSVGRVPI